MVFALVAALAFSTEGPPPSAELQDARAVAEAVGRLQNAWASQTLLSDVDPCTHGEARTLVTRSRVFGADLHRRLVSLQESAPDDPAVLELVEVYQATVAFQEKVIEPHAGDCAVAADAVPGIGPPTREPTAIIVRFGLLCPGVNPVMDEVRVVRGKVCLSAFDGCECTPRTVLPGEVLAAGGP